uniref:Uncharacterized protein n=1 Tax=Romanomermis culicivorax TaxID=13658 RepID=A0A915KGD6_ROMCU
MIIMESSTDTASGVIQTPSIVSLTHDAGFQALQPRHLQATFGLAANEPASPVRSLCRCELLCEK